MANAQEVSAGTWESLPPPCEKAVIKGIPAPQMSWPVRSVLPSDKARRNRQYRNWYPAPRETEGEEKGGGSLSIPIVPIESWEICPRKASE